MTDEAATAQEPQPLPAVPEEDISLEKSELLKLDRRDLFKVGLTSTGAALLASQDGKTHPLSWSTPFFGHYVEPGCRKANPVRPDRLYKGLFP
jgi:hypothetical protein